MKIIRIFALSVIIITGFGFVSAEDNDGAELSAPASRLKGVWSSGIYKNLFLTESNYLNITNSKQIDNKIYTAVSNFFGYGDTNFRCYFTNGSDKAYILDVNNNDVRSEGMSYGMMIAVQMNMKSEFDKLWNFAKSYMQHANGNMRAGYFSWQMNPNGSRMDNNPAPDGEQYFTMALLFAWKRWGNGAGIYNYYSEATNILQHMLYQNLYTEKNSMVTPMFTNNMVVFVPFGDSANFTDPSYHLPAFYELFARWDTVHASNWTAIAAQSRAFWKTACNPSTGLFPDYANFDGTPNITGNHAEFRFDAWRVIQNITLDYYWFNCAGGDGWEKEEADKLQAFFAGQGVTNYGNQYGLSGKKLSPSHSPGLVAMNAVASLIASEQQARDFVKDLWDISPTPGVYRYYDGCLYLLGLLEVSGNYKIWGRDESAN